MVFETRIVGALFVATCINIALVSLLVRRHAAMRAAISFLICQVLILAVHVAPIIRSKRLWRDLSLGMREFMATARIAGQEGVEE